MSQDPSLKARYTDREVSAILRKATQLQEQEEGAPVEGMSLEQVQQAAAELGIKPHLIAKAAVDIDSDKQPRSTSFLWGGPGRIEMERIVGYPITQENWPTVLEAMHRGTGQIGETRAIGRLIEWTSVAPTLFHVSISPQGEQSRVKVTSRVGEWGVACYALAGMSALITSLALIGAHPHWSLPVDLGVLGGLFSAAYGAARTIFKVIGRSHRRTAHALLSALENPTEQVETGRSLVQPGQAQIESNAVEQTQTQPLLTGAYQTPSDQQPVEQVSSRRSGR